MDAKRMDETYMRVWEELSWCECLTPKELAKAVGALDEMRSEWRRERAMRSWQTMVGTLALFSLRTLGGGEMDKYMRVLEKLYWCRCMPAMARSEAEDALDAMRLELRREHAMRVWQAMVATLASANASDIRLMDVICDAWRRERAMRSWQAMVGTLALFVAYYRGWAGF